MKPSTLATGDCVLLASRVKTFLAAQHFPALAKIEIEADGDSIRLGGRVGSFYERQLAIACCKRVAGVRKIVDCLEFASRDGNPRLGRPHQD